MKLNISYCQNYTEVGHSQLLPLYTRPRRLECWSGMSGSYCFVKKKIVDFSLYVFFSRTTEPISTKLGTKHHWMKGIQLCSNEGSHSIDDNKMAKIHWRNLKIFFSRPAMPISITLDTKLLMDVIFVCSNEGPNPKSENTLNTDNGAKYVQYLRNLV